MLEDVEAADLDLTARRKALLLRRLQQRRPVRQSNSGTHQAKVREEDLDEALDRAHEAAENGIVDGEVVKRLEGFLSLEGCGRSVKRIQDALELLRKTSLGSTAESSPNSTFSFSVSKAKTSTVSEKQPSSRTSLETASLVDDHQQENVVHLLSLSDEVRLIKGKDGCDVKLKDLRNCQLSFVFRPSTVYMQGIYDCKLVFLPTETSVLIRDCSRSEIFAAAQQLRIHNSYELRLHVAVRAAVIIESCQMVSLAPYRVIYNNEYVDAPSGDAWMRPNDFDWLAEGQSPNWSIAAESEWETHTIQSDIAGHALTSD